MGSCTYDIKYVKIDRGCIERKMNKGLLNIEYWLFTGCSIGRTRDDIVYLRPKENDSKHSCNNVLCVSFVYFILIKYFA